ncbi:FecCD family ABC transporter permease [Aidingimonas lacisalsi]|uniref:FecCD family ABC transporter permease n=1 Tax=Aidingimonas lacisalsi TaxID=2604086 RepID=UPI0011D22D5B|nr:iron ABC transporter permease [Aidingimonas lacisalsi]
MPEHWVIRLPGFSRIVTPEPWRRVGAILLLSLVVLGVSLAVGRVPLSLSQLGVALTTPTSENGLIVIQLRLPRALLGALVGGALGMSGWLFQQVMRNPLASPDIVGVTSGASAAAVGYFSLLATNWGMAWLPLAAILGALSTAFAIYLLAWQRGVAPLRLVLIGIGVSALLGAVTTFILVASPLTTTLSAYVWLTGSVYAANWSEVTALAGWCALLGAALIPLMRLTLLAPLDDALATGIGVRVQWTRALLLVVASMLAGVAVAWGGAFAFVGLVAPHMARMISRTTGTAQAVMAVLFGACMVMLADLLGRTLFLPLDLPAGIFVAAIGAPFFLTLLIRQRR